MTRVSITHVLTPDRLADLQAYARGEQPELQPLRRRWHVANGYLVPIDPSRPPRAARGRRRIAARRHELIPKGRCDAECAEMSSNAVYFDCHWSAPVMRSRQR